MTAMAQSERGFSKPLAIFSLSIAAITVALLYFGGTLHRFVRESLMQRVTSAHYEILCPPGALSQSAMTEFATQRETVFAGLDKKLGDANSNLEIRIIFDPEFPGPQFDATGHQPYSVTGTTIRTKPNSHTPLLSTDADAEALLFAAW